jgi:hypothetical protein
MKLKQYFEDRDWVAEHYKELQEKYPDEWVAVKDKTVISHGGDVDKVEDAFKIFVTSGSEVYIV